MIDAPQPTGELLCSISRPGYDGAADERLDVRLDRYPQTRDGRLFVSLRVWRFTNGAWYPLARKGLSVRLRELPDVIEALRLAERRSTREPRPLAQRQPSQRPSLPPAGQGRGFDEFGDG